MNAIKNRIILQDMSLEKSKSPKAVVNNDNLIDIRQSKFNNDIIMLHCFKEFKSYVWQIEPFNIG